MISEAAIMDLEPTAAEPVRPADHTLARARGGDLAAFEELMRCHERLVFGTARRLLGSTEDAEDAAQEIFHRLYHHLDHHEPARPVAAWLYRVTVNFCRTVGRRQRPTVLLGDAAESVHAAGADTAAPAELEEERRMAVEGLDTLARKERAALELHDLEGLSTRDVALALQISEGTVRTHLCRARQKMRAFRDRWYRRNSR